MKVYSVYGVLYDPLCWASMVAEVHPHGSLGAFVYSLD